MYCLKTVFAVHLPASLMWPSSYWRRRFEELPRFGLKGGLDGLRSVDATRKALTTSASHLTLAPAAPHLTPLNQNPVYNIGLLLSQGVQSAQLLGLAPLSSLHSALLVLRSPAQVNMAEERSNRGEVSYFNASRIGCRWNKMGPQEDIVAVGTANVSLASKLPFSLLCWADVSRVAMSR